MKFGNSRKNHKNVVPPNRNQIQDAITRFIESGGEINKLQPAPPNNGFDANDGNGFFVEKIRVGLSLETDL